MARVIEELKRRHVFKVMASYAVVAWLLIQVIVAVEDPLGLPAWSDTFVIVTLLIGFPIAAVLAWIYDITGRGIERTEPRDGAERTVTTPADRWSMTVAIGGAALLAITSAYLVLGSPGRTLDTLAMLPFEYVGDADGAAYLGAGLSDNLVMRLSRTPRLRIKSAAAVDAPADVQALGRLLDVAVLCRGRIVERGDTLDIVAELIDANDGSIIWRDEYSSQGTSLIGIEGQIAVEISRQLGFELTPAQEAELARSATNNAAANRLYLQGRYYWNRRTAEGFDASIDYYNRAIVLDPNYAPAWSGLANTYLMILGWGIEPPAIVAPQVLDAAERAIQLDSTLAEPHAALGYLHTINDRDWDAARREFLRAIELNPSYSSAHHWYAFLLLTEGNAAAALEEIQLAGELEPLSPIINAEVGYFFRFTGDYTRALEELEAARMLDPNYTSILRDLLATHALLGQRDAALEQLRRLRATGDNGAVARAFTAAVLPILGRESEARDVYDELKSETAQTYIGPGILGFLAAALGDYDAAFEYFEAGLEENSLILSWLRDPLLEGLHDDPRLAALFERAGLEL